MTKLKGKERTVTAARLFLDTCVWLDLVGSEANEPLLGALENLTNRGVIDLVVPQIVRDEFDRNKDRVIKESGRSLSSTLRRAKVAVWTYGDARKRRKAADVLDDIDYLLSNSLDVTAASVARVETLFMKCSWLGDQSAAMQSASARALQKKAPFHTGKNSFADAVILELYGQIAGHPGRSVFVTHNVKDFSLQGGDQRKPHSDISQYFSRIKSRYFIKLIDALRALRPNEFAEAMYEHEFTIEPRKPSEVLNAIDELTDRVWYDRHMVMRHEIQTGKCKIIAKKDFGPKHHRASGMGRLVVDDILAGAIKSANRVEKKYGKESLGPYSKFDWGMINGKLSALRWVIGEDWDELYT
ncbi:MULTISPECIES: PIN domain-containing protein [unclassified Bradyrhizobium]|uniref:PIN domain-containing protein n=1 Tax=unclassified Bradyrhizobium TaxID=2631580 RepID=UPI002FF12233